MIIKSLSRKSASFAQLYDYISASGWNGFSVWHNLSGYCPSRSQVLHAFYRNARYLSARKNGNALYHELISIPRHAALSVVRQAEILHDLTTRYLAERAPKQLGFAKLHVADHHIHVHLMLSANELNSWSRYRLQKGKFLALQRKLERYCQQRYPELEDHLVYSKKVEHMRTVVTPSSTGKEFEFKRRTGQLSQKEILCDQLTQAFAISKCETSLDRQLRSQDIVLKMRGSGITAIKGSLKCRLSTLGLEQALQQCQESFSQELESRLSELSALRDRAEDSGLEIYPDFGIPDSWL